MEWNGMENAVKPQSSFEQNISIKNFYSIERSHKLLLFARHFCSLSLFCFRYLTHSRRYFIQLKLCPIARSETLFRAHSKCF